MKRLWLLLIWATALLVTACQNHSQTAFYEASETDFFVDPHLTNVAMIVLDYQSLEIQRLYARKQTPCDDLNAPLPDDILLKKASGFFDAVDAYWTYWIVTDEHGQPQKIMGFEIKHAHDLAVLEMEPGDFGGFAIMHRCSGLLNFAGSIVWAGTGEQLFPAVPLKPKQGSLSGEQIMSPESLEVLIGPGAHQVDPTQGNQAWESARQLDVVQQISRYPHRVLVYLYPRSVGMFAPERASWIVVVYNIVS